MRKALIGGAIGAAIAVLAVMLWPGGSAGRPASSTGARAAAQDDDGTNEGIEVHGRWTIEVRNRNGSLDTRRRFENELVTVGGGVGNLTLAMLLARQKSVGLWEVTIGGLGQGPCTNQIGHSSDCLLVEPGHPHATFPNAVTSLEVSVDGADLLLKGSATAEWDSFVSAVNTYVGRCDPTVAPAQSCDANGAWFTNRVLSPVIDVASGQQILVTVRISFS